MHINPKPLPLSLIHREGREIRVEFAPTSFDDAAGCGAGEGSGNGRALFFEDVVLVEDVNDLTTDEG